MDDLTMVRDALDDAVSHLRPVPPTRQALESGLRRVRRTRRLRRTAKIGGALGGLAAALTALQFGVLSLPAWVPAVPITSPAASSLATGPVRGSLAGDAAFLAALRDRAGSFVRDEHRETWRVPGADAVDVIYAGDVGGYRIALVEAPWRWGVVEDRQQQWYVGAAGTPADRLDEGGNSDPSAVVSLAMGPGNVPEPAGPDSVALVLAAPGTEVTVSGPPVIAADATVTWPERTQVVGSDGSWWQTFPSDGRAWFVEAPGGNVQQVTSTWSWSPDAALAGVGTGRTDRAPDPERLVTAVQAAQQESGLAVDGSTRTLVWSGSVADRGVDVVAVTAPSGARVLTANVADADQQASVVLAKDAPDALAFLVSAQDSAATVAAFVGPADAVRARLSGSTAATVALVDGVGARPADIADRVTFLDAEGQVLATTTVQDALNAPGGPVSQKLESLWR